MVLSHQGNKVSSRPQTSVLPDKQTLLLGLFLTTNFPMELNGEISQEK